MRTLKINSLKSIFHTMLLTAFLTGVLVACQEANKAEPVQTSAVQPAVDLQAAVIQGNLEAIKQHIHAGSDLNAKDPMSGSTALISAATFGRTAIASALIDGGADLSVKNNDGATALHVAAFFCRVEIVQKLLDAGADKTLRNNFGATPRESIMGSFSEVKPIYEFMQSQLGPLGLELDMAELEKTRPVIAMMLQ
ncbi:MAG: ankyrin repeat domain-containing protein [Robiginitalea sp.]